MRKVRHMGGGARSDMIKPEVCCEEVGDEAVELGRAQVVLGRLSHARGIRDHPWWLGVLLNDHPDDIALQNQRMLKRGRRAVVSKRVMGREHDILKRSV